MYKIFLKTLSDIIKMSLTKTKLHTIKAKLKFHFRALKRIMRSVGPSYFGLIEGTEVL